MNNGWLYCDGRALQKASNQPYHNLWDVIGDSFGSGYDPDDQSKKIGDFNIPDLRGRFIRGLDDTKYKRDAGPRSSILVGGSSRGVGSYEEQAFMSHAHDVASRP
jgi:microcystin-dependent protein